MKPKRGHDWTNEICGNKHPHKVTDYIGSSFWSVECVKCKTKRKCNSTSLKNNNIRCYTCEPKIVNNTVSREKIIDMLKSGESAIEISKILSIDVKSIYIIKQQALRDNKIDAFESSGNMTFEEIGKIMGLSTQTIQTLYKSGIKRIFKLLDDTNIKYADYVIAEDENFRDYIGGAQHRRSELAS